MAAYAKVKIISMERTYNKGEKLELSKNSIKILVEQGMAYITETEETTLNENDEEFETVEALDEETLRKMSKSDLVTYATSIGLELSEKDIKEELISAILNYVEEYSEE